MQNGHLGDRQCSDVGWRGFHFLGTIDMDVQHPDEVAGNKMSSKDNGMET